MGQAVPPQKPPSPPAPLQVKSSPASESLNQAAKDYQSEKTVVDTSLQQARSALENSQGGLTKQLQAAQKELNDEIQSDKKYKAMFDKIRDLQKQIDNATATAQAQFNQKVGPVQSKMNSDKALMDGLIPIVKKENSLPDTATYDSVTQTWKENGAPSK